jgi:hypothetical protein
VNPGVKPVKATPSGDFGQKKDPEGSSMAKQG